MINKVEIASVNTSRLPVLSNEEKNELLKKIKSGDMEARDRFIEGNLRLVLSVVQRFSNRNENADDLFQIGCIGLIKAIDNFNVDLNVQFSTYAVPMIIGEIRRYLRDNNIVRVSRSVRDLAYKTIQLRDKLTKEKGKEPGIEELAKELGVYIMDQVKDSKNTDELWAENITIIEAIKRLSDREKRIVNMRFFDGKTQMEVAEEIGISQAQVSRLEKSAINRIKKIWK